ncbi:hypothetical protein FQR65_LT04004 [Abscondita terminalis]|nr:hypothetical protein FQR65_LT04004 [Abscondita terminalis]
MPQTIRLEFAKSNTKVSKPKQQAANAANTHPTLMHPLTGHLGTPFFPGGPELWHHPLAYSAAAELPGAALQHATLVHPALHPQVPPPLSLPHPTALTSIHAASLPHFLPSPALASPVGSSSSQPGLGVNNPPCSTLFVANLGQFVSEHELKEVFGSPSGKLVQIEYALAAVAAGAPSVGIKASNGVIIATENKHKSILYDEHSVHKVEKITKHIGMVYSGMGPDYRLLVKQARKIAQQYTLVYNEPIPTAQLVQRVAAVMQEYTQSGGVRPFGVSLLICGWDNKRPYLFQCDPSGAYFAWKATAMGKNFINGKTFLEKRYSEDLELDDAVHTAILTLKESFEGQMTADNIEVGICDDDGFRRLDPSHVKDYLANIP